MKYRKNLFNRNSLVMSENKSRREMNFFEEMTFKLGNVKR